MNVLIYLNGEDATESCRLQDTRISYDTSRRISTAIINVMANRPGSAAVYDAAYYDVDRYSLDVQEMYVVTIYDGRDGFTKLFEGQIFNMELEQTDAKQLEVFYRCDLNDYGSWLDRAVAWGGITIPMPTTDKVLIQTIVRTFCPQINADDVEQLIPVLVDYDWRTKTARQVLDDMATLSLGEWSVDYEARLHYGPAHDAPPAPFALSTTPDNVTSFPVRVSGYRRDFSNPINSCHVRGANDPLAGFPYEASYTDPVSVETYGPFDYGIVDDQITSFEDAELRAKSTVLRFAYPIEQGNFTIWKDDLRIGMNVHIHEDWLGIDGAYIIRALNLSWEDQETVRYEAQFGAAQPDLETYLRLLDARTRWKTSVPVVGTTGPPPPGSVTDESIGPGGLSAGVINSINANTILGQIQANQIGNVYSDRILGSITAGQIESVNAISIIGKVQADQIESVSANSISGVIQANQIGSVSAVSITGVILSSQLADQIIDTLSKYADALRPVQIVRIGDPWPVTMPNPNFPANSYFWYEPNGHFYRVTPDGMTWVDVGTNPDALSGQLSFYTIGRLSAQNIIGVIVAAQIQNITAGQITGLIQGGQIGSVNASTIQGTITAGQGVVIEGAVIQGTITAEVIGTINAGQITGLIRANQIETVTAGQISGTFAYNQIGSVNAATITIGLIQDTQIAGVNGAKVSVGSLTSDKFNGFSIDVGGLANMPGRIRVFDGTATVVAQMGYLGEVGAAAYGGWFKVFGAGGTWWGDAHIFTDTAGNLTIRDAGFTISGQNSQLYTSPTTFDATYSTLALKNEMWPDWASFISRGMVFYYGGGKIGSLVRSPNGGYLELECTVGGAYVRINGAQGVRSDAGYQVGGSLVINSAGQFTGTVVGTISTGGSIFTQGTMQANGGYFGGAFQGNGVSVGGFGIAGGSLNVGNGNVNCGAFSATGAVNCASLQIGFFEVISSFRQFVGAGVNVGGNQIFAAQYCISPGNGGGNGQGGTFTTTDGKTITVRGGIIISGL